MSDSIGIVILAAGKGTRMKITTPKALTLALGKPLLDYVVKASMGFAKESKLKAELGVVIGHGKELLEEWHQKHESKGAIKLALQKEQKGTADALKSCYHDLPHFWNHDFTLVACADTPLITENEFSRLFNELKSHPELVGVAATFETQNPTGYGRIIREKKGFRIIEEKDADENQKAIKEVNSGFYILRTSHVKSILTTISNDNKAGEFYLTDLFKTDYAVSPVLFGSEEPFLGINTLVQLAEVSGKLKRKKLEELMLSGVQILDPDTTYIESDVKIGLGTIIYPGVTLVGSTSLGERTKIESNSFIQNSSIGNEVQILASSHIEESKVEDQASIGPMARLRPGSEIGKKAKVGNFVEVKKSILKAGAKVSHLSYIGDAEIGEETNIGCGFITCNYDGANKHKTKIGKNTFIGSDCQAVAPVTIGDNSFVAAGTTITKDIPSEAFAISRPEIAVKEGMAKRFLKTKKT
jgi:bifunctional UDP-N-acetylglucosamine pyrophosphorylase / glucosamine-1-phosphate N-acetyltransferase